MKSQNKLPCSLDQLIYKLLSLSRSTVHMTSYRKRHGLQAQVVPTYPNNSYKINCADFPKCG